jgi:hypothetical protein
MPLLPPVSTTRLPSRARLHTVWNPIPVGVEVAERLAAEILALNVYRSQSQPIRAIPLIAPNYLTGKNSSDDADFYRFLAGCPSSRTDSPGG